MDERICIWCRKREPEVTFKKRAHTIPESLGGIDICDNVCDFCNHYFGSPQDKLPAIETVLKEAFNISRLRLLDQQKDIGKNRPLARFKSIYFNVDLIKRRIDVKPSFKLRKGFQSNLCRQFKRGLFKIYLEEVERQTHTGLLSKYDFIREFARYNLGDYPVLYFPKRNGILLLSVDEVVHPKIHLTPSMKFHVVDYSFFEFELLGHLFSIPTSREFTIMYHEYIRESTKQKIRLYKDPIQLMYLTQVDILLDIMNGK